MSHAAAPLPPAPRRRTRTAAVRTAAAARAGAAAAARSWRRSPRCRDAGLPDRWPAPASSTSRGRPAGGYDPLGLNLFGAALAPAVAARAADSDHVSPELAVMPVAPARVQPPRLRFRTITITLADFLPRAAPHGARPRCPAAGHLFAVACRASRAAAAPAALRLRRQRYPASAAARPRPARAEAATGRPRKWPRSSARCCARPPPAPSTC